MRTVLYGLTLPWVLALVGCMGSGQPAIRTIEVNVPVPQPCLTEQELAERQEPPMVGDLLGRTPETAENDRDVLSASNLKLRAWGRSLYFAHEACSQ